MTKAPSFVMAWKRAFLSPAGPRPLTRLVLAAMAMRMKPDGSGCFIGARGLAKLTGLDKSTTAEHRILAADGGWVIPPPNMHAPKAEWLPAIPPHAQVSGKGGQSDEKQLSGSRGPAVRDERQNCPVSADELSRQAGHISFLSPSNLLNNSGSAKSALGVEEKKRLIRDWVNRPDTRRTYDCANTALRVPENWRFAGFENFVKEVWREIERTPK